MPASEPEAKKKEEKVLVEWIAHVRPFKRRSRDFYITVISVATLLGLILFLIEGVMPVLLVIALVFLYYVLSTVEPDKTTFQVTSSGIKVGKALTPWEFLGRFWFIDRFGSLLLIVETAFLPGRMEIPITIELKEQIQKSLSGHLSFEKVSPSRFDKINHWFTSKLPS